MIIKKKREEWLARVAGKEGLPEDTDIRVRQARRCNLREQVIQSRTKFVTEILFHNTSLNGHDCRYMAELIEEIYTLGIG